MKRAFQTCSVTQQMKLSRNADGSLFRALRRKAQSSRLSAVAKPYSEP